MSSFPDFERKWDKDVKPAAIEVVKNCKSDSLVRHFVGQMIFYVEHDLADDRIPHLRLSPCVGTLNDESYYVDVHKNSNPNEVQKLRELGSLLKELARLDN